MLNSFWGPNSVLYKHCCVPSMRESQWNSTQISKTSPKHLFVCWAKEREGKELVGNSWLWKLPPFWRWGLSETLGPASKSPCSLEARLDSGPAVPKSRDKLCMWGAATAFTLNIDPLVCAVPRCEPEHLQIHLSAPRWRPLPQDRLWRGAQSLPSQIGGSGANLLSLIYSTP